MLEESKERSEPAARLVGALLSLSPLLSRSAIFSRALQGASEQAADVIGLAAFGKCLAAAGLNQPRGPKAAGDLRLLAMIMR